MVEVAQADRDAAAICKKCRWLADYSIKEPYYAKCSHPGNDKFYISTLFDYYDGRYGKKMGKVCPYSEKLIELKDTRLWLRMYKKGIEKEEIPLDTINKEKALVRANWLIMKIAHVADWFIKRYDERMANRRQAYIIRQAVDRFIS
jgi:hypothetical protein